jgi:hypothetical protein
VISFRYHVATIVAVFLALALGLLAGGAFVQPGLVDQLRNQTDSQLDTIADLRKQVGDLRTQAAGLEAFSDAALSHLTEERLSGTSVVLVAQEGVEDAVVTEARQALGQAGATVVALSARSALAPEDPEAQAALADILGLPNVAPEELPSSAAEALADRLASEARRAPGDPDVLRELLNEGYLTPIGPGVSDETLAGIGGPGQVVVVVSGGQAEEPAMGPSMFALPLVERLTELGLAVGAGESVGTVQPFVEALRAAGTDGTVTVDDLDLSMGGAALVLGLDRLLVTGDGGDYGVKDGATPLPPPS